MQIGSNCFQTNWNQPGTVSYIVADWLFVGTCERKVVYGYQIGANEVRVRGRVGVRGRELSISSSKDLTSKDSIIIL